MGSIEDWGITSNTKLDKVKCEYVFMRLVKEGDQDDNRRRKPDNWEETFQEGDFADFIKPLVDTLDLYHNHSVDPRAIAISFNQLVENNPDAELRIVGMEVRGENEDKFLIRAKTRKNANLSKLEVLKLLGRQLTIHLLKIWCPLLRNGRKRSKSV